MSIFLHLFEPEVQRLVGDPKLRCSRPERRSFMLLGVGLIADDQRMPDPAFLIDRKGELHLLPALRACDRRGRLTFRDLDLTFDHRSITSKNCSWVSSFDCSRASISSSTVA